MDRKSSWLEQNFSSWSYRPYLFGSNLPLLVPSSRQNCSRTRPLAQCVHEDGIGCHNLLSICGSRLLRVAVHVRRKGNQRNLQQPADEVDGPCGVVVVLACSQYHVSFILLKQPRKLCFHSLENSPQLSFYHTLTFCSFNAHFSSFAFIPLPFRVLYNNCLSLGWNFYLSHLNIDQMPSSWNQVIIFFANWECHLL